MPNIIAIRREDLNKKGEKRVAITPSLVHKLTRNGQTVWVQPGIHPKAGENKRTFPDQQYLESGAILKENIEDAQLIFGLKEIVKDNIHPEKAYCFFSHTHKGQVKNRKMLKDLVDKKCTVIDYELITDDNNQRLITAFTYFAGYAGMIDSLWTLGKKMKLAGISHPFSTIPQSVEKEDLELIKGLIKNVGKEISSQGTPDSLPPIICCFLGNGKTSTGGQEIFDLLPVKTISLAELAHTFENGDRHFVYKLVLDIPEMYRVKADSPYANKTLSFDETFQLYLSEPEHFESNLDQVVPYVTLLMNCIIWSPKYPRLMTRTDTKKWHQKSQTLQVIGDITCDPEGAIEFSKETWIDDPVFMYDPKTNTSQMGFEGDGIAVMAVTNLPCEFSADASQGFCENLTPFIERMAQANFQASNLKEAGLPPEIERATLLWRGKFTEKYKYMQAFIEEV